LGHVGVLLDQLDEHGGLGIRLGLVLFPFAQAARADAKVAGNTC